VVPQEQRGNGLDASGATSRILHVDPYLERMAMVQMLPTEESGSYTYTRTRKSFPEPKATIPENSTTTPI
jgi:hypothetical protein